MPRLILVSACFAAMLAVVGSITPAVLAQGLNAVIPFGMPETNTAPGSFLVVSMAVLFPLALPGSVRLAKQQLSGVQVGSPALFGRVRSGHVAAYRRRAVVAIVGALGAFATAAGMAYAFSETGHTYATRITILYTLLLCVACLLVALEFGDLVQIAEKQDLAGDNGAT